MLHLHEGPELRTDEIEKSENPSTSGFKPMTSLPLFVPSTAVLQPLHKDHYKLKNSDNFRLKREANQEDKLQRKKSFNFFCEKVQNLTDIIILFIFSPKKPS